MKKALRTWALVMLIALFSSLVALVCSATEWGSIDDMFYEISDDGEVTITAYYGHESELVIPSSIDDYPVTGISADFGAELESIAIPSTVKYISASFSDNIKKVYIEDLAAWCSVQFDSYMTNPLSHGADLYLNDTLLTDLVIPENITEINDGAFYGYKSLKSVTVHDEVTSIGMWAFGNCDNIETIYVEDLSTWCQIDFKGLYSNPLSYAETLYVGGTRITDVLSIPNTVTKINDYSFWGFKGFTELWIPESVTDIAGMAVIYCDNLQKISVSESNSVYRSIDGVLFSADCKQLLNYPMGNQRTTYTVPGTVTSIGDSVFRGCKYIEEVIIGDSVTTIGMCVFQECDELEKITVGSGVRFVDRYSFYLCPEFKILEIKDIAAWCETEIHSDYSIFSGGVALYLNGQQVKDLVIPDGVTAVRRGAFWGCAGIESVLIPQSVVAIESLAFYGCQDLTNVWYMGDADDFNNIQIDGTNVNLLNATVYYDACALGVEHIYDNACDTDCNVCSESRTVQHNFEWIVDRKENCGNYGIKHEECSVCHAKRSENTSINATGDHKYDNICDPECNVCKLTREAAHNFLWIIDNEPSCGVAGTKHEKCTRCNEERNSGTAIPALEHSMGQWVVTKEACCEEKGEQTRSCTLCEREETEEIPATGHEFVLSESSKQPTCTEDGVEILVCALCQKETATALDAKGHEYGNVIIIKEATEKEPGFSRQTCKVCNSIKEEVIPMLTPDAESKEPTIDILWIVLVSVTAFIVIGLIIFFIIKKRAR